VTPKTRETLLLQVKVHEGLRLRVYLDTKGTPTIGIGHNMEVDPRMAPGTALRARLDRDGCTRAEALAWLREDMDIAAAALSRALPWANQLDEVRQAVLVELAFNMGIGFAPGENPRFPKGKGLRSFVNTLAKVERGDYEAAARGLLWNDEARKIPSKWHSDVKARRANTIANEMATGRWPAPNTT
jgi:lysozyme